MATVTERLAIIVEANAGKAIAEFKTLGNATKGLSGDVGKAGGLLSNIGGQLGGIASAAGPAAAIAGIGLAIGKFTTAGISGFIDLASQVKAFRLVAGGTAEDASKLVAGFKAVGIDATTAGTGVFQLEKHLASGADKLAQFGITAQKDSKGNTDMAATLLSVGDAYKRTADPIQRAALLTAAFGRAGTTLVPLLAKSREEIQHFFDEAAKHHEILSADDLKKVTDYKLAMHDLSEAFKGLEISAGKALVPFIADIAKAITGAIDLKDKVSQALHVDAGGGGAGGIGAWLDGLIHGKDAADAADISTDHLGTSLSGVANILDGFKTANDDAAKALDDLDKALSAASNADHALADAHQNTIDAQAALNKLQKDGAVDAQKVADATVSLAEATRSVGHAQREQTKAQGDYNEALAAFKILGTDTARDKLTDASNNLADANDSVADSQDRANKAAKDLADAKAGDPDYQEHLADAKNKVADATFNESQRALASVTAHAAETTALSDNADQVQRLYDKYQAMIKQHPEVAAALAGNLTALAPAVANQNSLAGVVPTFKPGDPAAILGALGGTTSAPPVRFGPPVPTSSGLPTQPARGPITINNTFNTPIDPAAIGRQMIWDLN